MSDTELRTATEKLTADLDDTDIMAIGEAAPTGLFRVTLASLKAFFLAGGGSLPVGGTAGQVLTKIDGTDGNADWETPSGGGGGGALVQIAQTVISAGGTSTISFASIPDTYQDLIVSITAHGGGSGLANDIVMSVNGDTGNNYEAFGWSRFGSYQNIPSAPPVMATIELASTALYLAPNEIIIQGYAQTSFYKSGMGLGVTRDSNIYHQQRGFYWKNTAAISQLDFALVTGNYNVGSVITLYGRG